MEWVKWVVMAVACLILSGVIANAILHLVERSLAKNVLVIGLSIAGIILVPYIILRSSQ